MVRMGLLSVSPAGQAVIDARRYPQRRASYFSEYVIYVIMTSIISWNINSIRKRLGHIERLVDAHAPDVLCLQETKASDAAFPIDAVRKLGFDHIATYGYGGYNGVAILSKHPLTDIQRHARRQKTDGRHISAVMTPEGAAPMTVHSVYVPAGGEEPDPRINDKFADKLAFIDCCAD